MSFHEYDEGVVICGDRETHLGLRDYSNRRKRLIFSGFRYLCWDEQNAILDIVGLRMIKEQIEPVYMLEYLAIERAKEKQWRKKAQQLWQLFSPAVVLFPQTNKSK